MLKNTCPQGITQEDQRLWNLPYFLSLDLICIFHFLVKDRLYIDTGDHPIPTILALYSLNIGPLGKAVVDFEGLLYSVQQKPHGWKWRMFKWQSLPCCLCKSEWLPSLNLTWTHFFMWHRERIEHTRKSLAEKTKRGEWVIYHPSLPLLPQALDFS